MGPDEWLVVPPRTPAASSTRSSGRWARSTRPSSTSPLNGRPSTRRSGPPRRRATLAIGPERHDDENGDPIGGRFIHVPTTRTAGCVLRSRFWLGDRVLPNLYNGEKESADTMAIAW